MNNGLYKSKNKSNLYAAEILWVSYELKHFI